MLQRRSVQIFHSDERPSVLLAHIIDRANIGMIQARRGLRFSLEPSHDLRNSGHVFGEKLECYETVETGIFSFIDYSHPSSAEFLDDAVVRDGLADHCWKAVLW